MDQHLGGHTTEQYGRHAVSTVGGHNDQIAPDVLSGVDDRLVGILMVDMQNLACEVLLRDDLSGGFENFCGLGGNYFSILIQ